MAGEDNTDSIGGGREGPAVGAISARERDLDNFLLEELSASPGFRTWLSARVAPAFEVPPHARLVVGKNPKREAAAGQTDLGVLYLDELGNQVALLLIESKVALGFQPGQPDRYKREVESARMRLGQLRAAAIVVAPRSNRTVVDHPLFDGTIQIEEIVEHLKTRIASELQIGDAFAAELRARLENKVELLEYLAGKRPQPSWLPNPIPERLSFMELYRQVALELAPRLTPTASSGGAKATTVLFTGLQVPGLKCGGIRHDFGKTQRASLVLPGAAAAHAALLGAHILPRDAQVDATKAGALLIRLATPSLTPSKEHFDAQRSLIKECIGRVLELETWIRAHARQLEVLVQRAPHRASPRP